jgi:outer membrane protein OmpA-like peptidoglycan-associated protein
MLKNYLWIPVSLCAACASSPPQHLVDARAAYQRASHGAAATESPAQLHVAKTSLGVAEQTFSDEGDSPNARDRAYVALRKAELAEAQANIAMYDKKTALAAARVEKAKANSQLAAQRELQSTQVQLARERESNAGQRAELASETQRRLEAERRASDALSALSKIGSVTKDDRGTIITLSGAVIFASGHSELLPAAKSKLDQVATALNVSESASKIIVQGYTDSRGSAALNQDLSTRRAESVKDYLVSKGVAGERLSSEGLGPSNPVADNETAEGRANNRRVEIIVQPVGDASRHRTSSN